MKGVTVTGESVEQALEKGMKQLGIEDERELEYEVIQQAEDGFLNIFGGQEAKIRVTPKQPKVEIARDFLEQALAEMELGFELELLENREEAGEAVFNISGQDLGIIIGHRGKTLDALQYLANLAVNKGEREYLRVILDAEGYRERRKETLQQLARKMASKAKKGNKKVVLDPMPPHERRIIHTTLQNVSGVSTYSKGEDPHRKVVITTE